ncbi:hypothetical protein [Archangium violaceum]|uniref:Uncharacterized protein n=1 Tax=Archangium violaceum Cb vi76 TaxID=1406225 RepID=A0A084SN47_9BACT|nr:hypothetical protein [Archangium violaceum]KFA89882.1 hypothetical protein Q664_32045 [Archangium violaceum Cb vi76]
MSTDLHIIATCSDRKRAPIPPGLHLRTIQATAPESRARLWWNCLRDHPHPTYPAQDLYAGDHWSVVLELPTLATQAGLRSHLWVASAGYGLIPASAPIRPYSATFSRGHEDSVIPKGESRPTGELLQHWWKALARESSPMPGSPRHIRQLAESTPHARILVVASPAYVAAFTDDLVHAAQALRKPEHLLIVSTPAPLFKGVLAPHQVPSNAHLQEQLGGARQSLHARVARHILERARDEGSEVDAAHAREYYEGLIHRSAPPVRYERTPMTDDEVRQFIVRALRTRKLSCSATLRQLRDSGLACEQKRFSRLFHALQERA